MHTASATQHQPQTHSEALRHEAYHLALSVLPIFETVFPDNETPRMALQMALDVAEGRHDYSTMQVVREWLQDAIDTALVVESETQPESLYPIHAAVNAVMAVGFALDPVINLEAMHAVADKALFFAPVHSRRTH